MNFSGFMDVVKKNDILKKHKQILPTNKPESGLNLSIILSDVNLLDNEILYEKYKLKLEELENDVLSNKPL